MMKYVRQRFGAEEAHWAHNPRVGGSKLPIARRLFFFFSTLLPMSVLLASYSVQDACLHSAFWWTMFSLRSKACILQGMSGIREKVSHSTVHSTQHSEVPITYFSCLFCGKGRIYGRLCSLFLNRLTCNSP